MFKFEFDLDDEDIDTDIDTLINPEDVPAEDLSENPSSKNLGKDGSFVEKSVECLLNALPTRLSYSPLEISLASSSSHPYYLSRRDLFDARFQLISEEKASENDGDPRLQFLDTPSDLVPGVYEGGLKTWECSLDLVDYLHASLDDGTLKGSRVLELGCGTGVPSLYLLQRIFSSPFKKDHPTKTVIHLQDYNSIALELVTFPNVLLAWYMSPASTPFLSSQAADPASQSDFEADDFDSDFPVPDSLRSGDLPITPALKNAFIQSLETFGVELRFFGGSWNSLRDVMLLKSGLGGYNIVLTSETIYHTEGIPELIGAIWDGTRTHPSASAVSESLAKMNLSGLESTKLPPSRPLILVAAKIFYFGVGGGVDEFVEAVRKWNRNGKEAEEAEEGKSVEVTTVWEKNIGVGRKIVRILW